MTNTNRLYLERMGLVSVVVLSNESRIIRGKFNIVEEIVCFKSLKPYYMKVRWIENKKLGFNYKVEKSKVISEEEYDKLKDTPFIA